MIYIRADGNSKIGTGHLMRCMSVAEELIGLGEKILFLLSDADSASIVDECGFEYKILNTKWDELNKHKDREIDFLCESPCDLILIDSYFADNEYIDAIRTVTKVFLFDDYMESVFSCDGIINYAIYADEDFYRRNYPGKVLLLGCKYAPVRKEFRNIEKHTARVLRKVLLLSGGTDEYSILYKLCLLLKERKEALKGIEFIAVCGVYNKDYEKIKEISKIVPNIKVLNQVGKMWELMKEVDLAVSAGGTTLYELCATKTPAISYSLADNQINNVLAFQKMDIFPYMGDVTKDEVVCERIIEKILEYSRGFDSNSIINKMKNLVDGYGAKEIALELIAAIKPLDFGSSEA